MVEGELSLVAVYDVQIVEALNDDLCLRFSFTICEPDKCEKSGWTRHRVKLTNIEAVHGCHVMRAFLHDHLLAHHHTNRNRAVLHRLPPRFSFGLEVMIVCAPIHVTPQGS